MRAPHEPTGERIPVQVLFAARATAMTDRRSELYMSELYTRVRTTRSSRTPADALQDVDREPRRPNMGTVRLIGRQLPARPLKCLYELVCSTVPISTRFRTVWKIGAEAR